MWDIFYHGKLILEDSICLNLYFPEWKWMYYNIVYKLISVFFDHIFSVQPVQRCKLHQIWINIPESNLVFCLFSSFSLLTFWGLSSQGTKNRKVKCFYLTFIVIDKHDFCVEGGALFLHVFFWVVFMQFSWIFYEKNLRF